MFMSSNIYNNTTKARYLTVGAGRGKGGVVVVVAPAAVTPRRHGAGFAGTVHVGVLPRLAGVERAVGIVRSGQASGSQPRGGHRHHRPRAAGRKRACVGHMLSIVHMLSIHVKCAHR